MQHAGGAGWKATLPSMNKCLRDLTTLLCIGAVVWALSRLEVSGRFPLKENKDQEHSWSFAYASCIAGTAWAFEASFVLSTWVAGVRELYISKGEGGKDDNGLHLQGLKDAQATLDNVRTWTCPLGPPP